MWAEEQDWFGMEEFWAIEAEKRAMRAEELIKQGYWLPADLEPIALRSMTDLHLYNCIKMINEGRLNRPWALPYLKREVERRKRNRLV